LKVPAGRIDWSVPCGRHLDVIINDVAIDTGVDPFQRRNGILNLGKFRMVGCERARSFTTTATDTPSGATSITLDVLPAWWSVGDELIIPDTRQQEPYEYRVRKNVAYRESRVTIAAISGNTITLSKALDYVHNSIRDFDGKVVLKPRVANIPAILSFVQKTRTARQVMLSAWAYPSELKRAIALPPPAANGLHVITYGDKNPWLPGTPPSDLTGCSQGIVNWQGTGQNYCLRTGS
jgi:hypothetical protein